MSGVTDLSDPAAEIAGARRHDLGALLARTAARTPDRTAIVWRRADARLRRVQRRRQPDGQRPARSRRAARRPDRRALAQLPRVRGRLLRAGQARRHLGADQLHAQRRRGRLHPRPLRRQRRHRRGRARPAPCSRPSSGRAAAPRRCAAWIAAAGGAVARRLGDGRRVVRPRATTPTRASLVDDDDPIQLMYTSGTESRPKGAIMTSRIADHAVRRAASSTAG